nr:DUF2069 domain-containing protein [Pseudomonadota bacterium]
MTRLARWLALASHFALLGLLLAWSVWLAPSPHYPVALTVLVWVCPLLFPLRGLLYGRLYTHIWTSLLALFYFLLGVDDVAGAMAPPLLAWLEVLLSLLLFAGCVAYV